MPRLLPICTFVFCLSALAVDAVATVTLQIDYDISPPAPSTQVGFGSYQEDGFTTKPLGPVLTATPFLLRRNGGSNTGFPENGSAYLQLALGDSLEVFQDSGEVFTPISVDLAEYSDLFAAVMSVGFTGYFSSGPPVTTSFSLDGIIDGTGPMADFETFLFPSSFENIIRLESTTNFFSADRLIVSVPEPGRAALLLLGLMLAVASRQRRTRA